MASACSRSRGYALVAICALAAACGSSRSDGEGDGGVAVGGDAGGRSGSDGGAVDAGPNSGPWAPISIAATAGPLTEAFDVQISGQGLDGGAVGAVSIRGDVGTLEISGTTFPVVAYEQIFFATADETLYQLLGAGPDRLVVAWAYCSAGTLNEIWYETTAGVPVTYEAASGTCSAVTSTDSVAVDLPAVQLGALGLVQGFTLQGAQLSFVGADAGVMELSGQSLWIYPFNTVDCTACGSGSPGWYELHSVIRNPATAETCFGIYYLFVVSPPMPVQLDYVLCLPGLNRSHRRRHGVSGELHLSRWRVTRRPLNRRIGNRIRRRCWSGERRTRRRRPRRLMLRTDRNRCPCCTTCPGRCPGRRCSCCPSHPSR